MFTPRDAESPPAQSSCGASDHRLDRQFLRDKASRTMDVAAAQPGAGGRWSPRPEGFVFKETEKIHGQMGRTAGSSRVTSPGDEHNRGICVNVQDSHRDARGVPESSVKFA
jgi:hypothetical protein